MPGPGAGSSSMSTSRRRREVSARAPSRNLRQAAVTSQALGSRGGSSGQTRRASTRASCTASSAAAKSAPRRPRIPITVGVSALSRDSSTRPSLRDGLGLAEERAALEPLVDRLPTGARSRGQLTGQLERPYVGVNAVVHPAGDRVLGLGERAVSDRRPPLAVVAHERSPRGERLTV